jgi:hypothetical protein
VISVQTIVLSLESLQIRRNHNWLKSLSFFFSQPLKMKIPAASACRERSHGGFAAVDPDNLAGDEGRFV